MFLRFGGNCFVVVLALLSVVASGRRSWAADAGVGPNPTAVEALRRLKGMDLDANPSLKGALMKVVESSRGTPLFVEWVRDFKLTGQEPGLLEVAARHPEAPEAAEAMRLVLRGGGLSALKSAMQAQATNRAAWIQVCAALPEPAVQPLLEETMADGAAPIPLRATAVRGLARTENGAKHLLKTARAGQLDENLRNTAALALAQARWPGVKSEAAEVLPLPKAADGSALPSMGELVRLRGDAGKGGEVFRSEQAACIKCHRVGNEGVEFGPALSLIGAKLGRQALYESILDPSAGISFGYEGWTFEVRGGEELVGLLASETAEEVVVKQQTGAQVKLKAGDVIRREKSKLSVMPAGLGQILTRQQLVDVVEYLTTLK